MRKNTQSLHINILAKTGKKGGKNEIHAKVVDAADRGQFLAQDTCIFMEQCFQLTRSHIIQQNYVYYALKYCIQRSKNFTNTVAFAQKACQALTYQMSDQNWAIFFSALNMKKSNKIQQKPKASYINTPHQLTRLTRPLTHFNIIANYKKAIKMHNNTYQSPQLQQLGLMGMSKSSSSPSRHKYYRIDMMANALTNEEATESKQEEKFREYLEELDRDNRKYVQIKDKMKTKFFKIKATRESKLRRPPLLDLRGLLKVQDYTTSAPSSDMRTSRTYNISNSNEINKQITTILQASLQLALSSQAKPKPKVRTRSELEKKNKQQTDKQRSLIINFVKKSNSLDMGKKRWEDLSNRDKYLMNFTDYVKKKTRSAIDNDIYERKIQRKSNQMEKFQDFLLQEVQFNTDHKEKLSHFFKQIRGEFKRSQDMKQKHKIKQKLSHTQKKKPNKMIPIFPSK